MVYESVSQRQALMKKEWQSYNVVSNFIWPNCSWHTHSRNGFLLSLQSTKCFYALKFQPLTFCGVV